MMLTLDVDAATYVTLPRSILLFYAMLMPIFSTLRCAENRMAEIHSIVEREPKRISYAYADATPLRHYKITPLRRFATLLPYSVADATWRRHRYFSSLATRDMRCRQRCARGMRDAACARVEIDIYFTL